MNKTKTYYRILEAIERGYCVSENGLVYGPKGLLKIKKHGKQKYPTISTNWGGKVFSIPAHQLAAICFYGEDVLLYDCIRHLDADTTNLSKTNIVLGSRSENELDKPKEHRIQRARAARAVQGITPINAKLTPENVNLVRKYYKDLNGKKAPNGQTTALAMHLGVSRTVLSKIKTGQYYCTVN